VRNATFLDTATLLLNVFGYVIIILLGPTFFVLIQFSGNIFPAFQTIRSNQPTLNILSAGVIAFAAAHGAVCLIAIVDMMLLLCFNAKTWVKCLW